MTKAVISNRIYMSKPTQGFEEIIEALTYKLVNTTLTKGGKAVKTVEVIKNYKILPRNIISIPQGREDLIPEGYEIIDKRVTVDMPFPEPLVPLRDSQQPVYDEASSSLFLNALPGWGKTFTALHIARKLGQKTLIVTHNTMLRDQWIKEVRILFGFEPGIIGSSKFDIDSTIVVGNIQTVTKHALTLCKEFGTVIMDEAHHCPASTFTTFIDAMYAKYRIGLSGTLERKDGKQILFKDYFGPVILRPPQSHTLDPTVKIIRSGIALAHGQPWTTKINNLLYDHDYQQYIAAMVKFHTEQGHKVLVVASRTEFLTNLKELLGESCMLVTGETELEQRESIAKRIEAGEITSVAGARSIFTEGISVNPLSCVILAEPIANVINLEQLIGRIMRQHPNKLNPLVLDINFSGFADKKQNNLRLGFYLNKGWDVEAV